LGVRGNFRKEVIVYSLDADVLFLVRIGQETLMEENWPDDDIEIELAPLAVQLAYLQQVK
jgi:signal recognition particle subunit SRP72